MAEPEREPKLYPCRFCLGRGFILRTRQDGSEVRETCLRCDGAGWAIAKERARVWA